MKITAALALAMASLATAESLHYGSASFSAHHTAMATTVREVQQYNNAGPTHLASSDGSSESYSEAGSAILPVEALQSGIGMVPYPAPSDYAFEGTHEGTPFSQGYFKDMEESLQHYKGKLSKAQETVEDDDFAARPSVTPAGLTGQNLERLNGPFLADSDGDGSMESEYPYNLDAYGPGQAGNYVPAYSGSGFSRSSPSKPDLYGYSYDREGASEAAPVYYRTRTVPSQPLASPAYGSGAFVAQAGYPVYEEPSTGDAHVTGTSRVQQASSTFESEAAFEEPFSSSTTGYHSLQTGDALYPVPPSNVTHPTVGTPVGDNGLFENAASNVISSGAALALAAVIGVMAFF